MLTYKEFINESKKEKWILDDNFRVTEDMVSNGKLISDLIPDEVTGYFSVKNVNLTTLEGCPDIVGKNLFCSYNELTNLDGIPSELGGSFYCLENNLTSLEGCPQYINGNFSCSNNELSSLKNGPDKVKGQYMCVSNKLKSLEYVSLYIGKYLESYGNVNNLTVEQKFIKSDNYINVKNYWSDLLSYMIKEKIDVNKVKGWPEGFLDSNIGRSVKSIGKFNL